MSPVELLLVALISVTSLALTVWSIADDVTAQRGTERLVWLFAMIVFPVTTIFYALIATRSQNLRRLGIVTVSSYVVVGVVVLLQR